MRPNIHARSLRPTALAVGFVLALALSPGAAVASGPDTLTLRVDDVTARPGGEAVLVLRTYASRPIDLGQVCLRSTLIAPPGPGTAPLTLTGAVVWSDLDDVAVAVEVDTTVDPPAILLAFESPSGTINTRDGPLAALFFDVDPGVAVGTEAAILVDLEATSLVDPAGVPIAIHPVDGELEVVAVDTPWPLEAEGDEAAVGMPLTLGAGFGESQAVARGQVALVMPPALAAGLLEVEIDPRFGNAVWSVDGAAPGRIEVAFRSPDASLGRLPGQFLRMVVDTTAVPSGVYPIAIDPQATFLADPVGAVLPLALEVGEAVVVGAGFFRGDFERGDFSGWSAVIGDD